jgi:hypothetical protein
MPGYERTPFFSAMSIFGEQPVVAARIETDTPQSIPASVQTTLSFATPILIDPLQTEAWRTIWAAATPGQFVTTIRGFYAFGGSVMLENVKAGRIFLAAIRNGVVLAGTEVESTAASFRLLSVATLSPAVVGDVFRLDVFQDAVGAINSAPIGGVPNMWMIRIG